MKNKICKKIEEHVTELFESNPNPNLVYHNLDHTENVVNNAREIAAQFELGEEDLFVLCAAAWFHDTGHLFVEIEKHEDKSVELMKEFMKNEGVEDAKLIAAIAGCINATRMPHNPKNLLEEIMCDADTYNFGTKEFRHTNKLVKKELELRGYNIVLDDWEKNTLNLLEKHAFFTSYCRILLEEDRQKNIKWIKKKIAKLNTDNTHQSLFTSAGVELKDKKEDARLLGRGLQTMLRLTSTNHFHLSEMADRKANILISVNSILIGIILSLLIEKLSDDPYLTIPVLIFMASCLTTIVIAIFATRPKITEGKFTKDDIMAKQTNLLFFGNFYSSTLEDYQWAMSTLMKDSEYLYSVIVKDIYQMGVVLGRKYKLIRLSYNVFMVGLVLSVVVFFIAAAANLGHQSGGAAVTNGSGSPF